MSTITITPTMTVQQLADLIEQHSAPKFDVYIHIESVRGKPVAFLVREPVIDREWIPPTIRRQAPNGPV